jgi:hypothetical protein
MNARLGIRRSGRLDWVGRLFALAALVLVPWIVVLVRMLPSEHRAAHWDIAWAGFDIALAFLLLGVAVAAWRRSPWLEGASTAAATLLFVDAWFDILTSSSHREFVVAIVEAVLVELPLAVLCLAIARSAERRLATVSRSRLSVVLRGEQVADGEAPIGPPAIRHLGDLGFGREVVEAVGPLDRVSEREIA